MKKLIILAQFLAVAALICCGAFLYINGNINVELINPAITLPLWCLKFGSFVVGILTAVAILGVYVLKQTEKYSALERRNEKKEITSDANEAKIKVLENKIASLEKALDKALGK